MIKFDDFENRIKRFEKIRSYDIKKQQKVFKSNLNKIAMGRYKSEEQERALENIKMLYEEQEQVIGLIDGYSVIASDAKDKTIHGEKIKILGPKQILQRFPIGHAQVK